MIDRIKNDQSVRDRQQTQVVAINSGVPYTGSSIYNCADLCLWEFRLGAHIFFGHFECFLGVPFRCPVFTLRVFLGVPFRCPNSSLLVFWLFFFLFFENFSGSSVKVPAPLSSSRSKVLFTL